MSSEMFEQGANPDDDVAETTSSRPSSDMNIQQNIPRFASGKTLVTSDYHTFALKVWDVPSRSFMHDLRGHTGVPFDLAISPDGMYLASGGNDQTVRLWDLINHKAIEIHPCGFRISKVSFSWLGVGTRPD